MGLENQSFTFDALPANLDELKALLFCVIAKRMQIRIRLMKKIGQHFM